LTFVETEHGVATKYYSADKELGEDRLLELADDVGVSGSEQLEHRFTPALGKALG
jgi:hypothetical protein